MSNKNKYLDRGEDEVGTKIFRKFKGVVNNSARTALPDEAWSYLENIQPIGDANLLTVPNVSTTLHDYGANPIYWSQYANINGADYLICFSSNGNVYAWNIVSLTNTTIGTGFSGVGSRAAQWKNTELLVVDSTGYYSWGGTGSLTLISGTGVPTSGTDIAVYAGRVWIVQGRLITGSGANDYTASSFTVANGAFSIALVDPTFRNNVVRLSAQNGYLYVISATGINAISDVYVPSGASPPTPLFTNLNIQAIIGSDQPASIFAMNQALQFCNRFGAWSLYGTNAQKISTDIDGTWKYLDFSQPISGGQVVVNNILCSAFLVKRLNDPVYGSNQVLAMNHDNKWWFANFGAMTFATFGIVNNEPALFGFVGNKLVQCFGDPTTDPASIASTALWPMEDELADKLVLRAGFEVTINRYNGSFGMKIDTVNISSQVVTLNNNGNIGWVNNSNAMVTWVNNANAPVQWFAGSYLLYNSVSPYVGGKYVGATVSATASGYQLSSINMDYKLKARWQ